MLFAIVDIETTGSYALGNGITEIAIVIHDGQSILHQFETLVNPNRPIPLFIQKLTGITDEMVAIAPMFQEVAAHIYELLQDKVFVAHNVNFDYSFVKHQLQRAGFELDVRKLCTVRLARAVLPGKSSYSLGKLCHHLGISLENHHRAGGDALATAQLFTLIMKAGEEEVIKQMLKGKSKDSYLPPHLPLEQVTSLPELPGVYYFYNAAGKVVYVGKANNLLKRVKSHFANNKTGRQKQDLLRDVHRVAYQVCATELIAQIMESSEIRKLWPQYNRSQRGYLPQYGLFVYEDQQGYSRLLVERLKSHQKPLYAFNSIAEGHSRIRALISEFELCPRLCSLTKLGDCAQMCAKGLCAGHCMDACEPYNERVASAVAWLQKQLPSFAFVDKGLGSDDYSCILMYQGNVLGLGCLSDPTLLDHPEELRKELQPLLDNDYIRNLVYKAAAAYPERCRYWEGG